MIKRVYYSVTDDEQKVACHIVTNTGATVSSKEFMMIPCYSCAKKHAFKDATNKARKKVREDAKV